MSSSANLNPSVLNPRIPPSPDSLIERRERAQQGAIQDLERVSSGWRGMLAERGPRNPAAELYELCRPDYEREPVSVETFIYDDYYLGRSLKGSVFPASVDDLVELFEGDYLEVWPKLPSTMRWPLPSRLPSQDAAKHYHGVEAFAVARVKKRNNLILLLGA